MGKPLPSLIALRVFEAAGRLQSFSLAANELNVTQGAVSRQIRVLEDELGVKLFSRLTRRVELTSDARVYLQGVQTAFRQLEASTSWLRSHLQHHVLNISVLPTVGTCWLMPRLASFSRTFPNIETRIHSSIEPAELHGHAVDVAIRAGPRPGQPYDSNHPEISLVMTNDWRGVLAEELAPDVLVPVYSPNIMNPGSRLDDAAVFHNLPIIHTASRPDAWPGWMRTFGLAELPTTPRIEYGHFFMSLDAARYGLGVALIPDVVMANSDDRGLYVANDYSVASAGAYHVLSLRSRSNEHAIASFRHWVMAEFPGASAATEATSRP